jgi:transposase, IS5 family
MQGKITHNPQSDLFKIALKDIVSERIDLVRLTSKIEWTEVETYFGPYYSEHGRPSVPTRTMVGLLLLKSMFSVADEELIPSWIQNPYWQFFCGEQYFRDRGPCDPSDLVHFRKRIGKTGGEYLLKLSVQIHGKDAFEESQVLCDTTVQEKDITFPTDSKLYYAIIEQCWRIAQDNHIKLHQSFKFLSKSMRLKLRFAHHPKKKKEARHALKKLRSFAHKLIAQLKNRMNEEQNALHKERFDLFERVLKQQKGDSNKIYSLHEPDVYCMAKGKEHKTYEFGCKASIALTKTTGIIVAATTFEKNTSDVHTVEQTLEQISYTTDKLPEELICDRGYRGKTKVKDCKISIPKPLADSASRYQKKQIQLKFRRRAAIEPIIGHLKYQHRMARNFLKGTAGDFMNCVLAAAGFNLKKMLRKLASSLNCQLKLVFCYFFAQIISSKKVAF